MASKNENNGAGASWARPALALLVLIAGTALATYLFGAPALAVSLCIVIVTASAYILIRLKAPFPTGLSASAAGGVLGMITLLAVLGAAAGVPLSEAAASWPMRWLESSANAGDPITLNLLVYYIRQPDQLNMLALLSDSGWSMPAEILSMPVADKLAAVRTVMEMVTAVYIPALALSGGLLLGALAYWLPRLMHARRAGKAPEQPDAVIPPFAAFKVPKYIVVSLLLVQIVASFSASLDAIGWLTVRTATEWTFYLLMNVQALSLFSFLLNRKRVSTGLQILIFIPAVILFWWLLYWVGVFDALFDLRVVLPKVEEVRAKGKQVFTQDGLEELRKMQEAKRNDKKGKDGEDGKK